MASKRMSVLSSIITIQPEYRDFGAGYVGHSQADISKTKELLGYEPSYRICQGIYEAMPWYVEFI